ncbi:MAG: hypothetical protein O6849_00595, partial [Candidatus Dadabacteria bacterium]|nr:hypothetical protein [Candidatus Dadabacteria bacterium]
VMLFLFSSGVDSGMSLHIIPQEVQETFKGEYIKLADAEMPLGIDPGIEEKLKNLVELSYVRSFNVLMYIAAGLSLLSALVAWIMIRDKQAGMS